MNGEVFLISKDENEMKKLPLQVRENIFAEFVRQIRGEGACLISATDSFYITEVCLAARDSADQGIVLHLK